MMLRGRGRSRDPGDSAELRALDRELREIVIDERCSFGPELRSELVRDHRRRSDEMRPASLGRLWLGMAAAIVLLAAGVLSVPRTRSSLLNAFRPAAVPEVSTPVPPVRVGGDEFRVEPVDPGEVIDSPELAGLSGEVVRTDSVVGTLPVLLDRNAARRTVAAEYPPLLQERGVGGTVRMMVWVSPEGAVELPQIDNSSGLAELDQAALRATRTLRFEPATRLGVPVGTWVTFPIRFLPNATHVESDPESEGSPISLSN